jgi:hypothetical protein
MFNTGNFTQNLAKLSFAQMITRLMPNGQAPLFAISSMMKSENAVQPEHGFFTKTMLFPQATLSAGVANGTDNIFTITDSSNILPGMSLRSQDTGEVVLVDNIISPTSIQVVRGVGTVAAGAITNSTNLYQIGSAYEEGSVRPIALNITPVRITNYTQIFRNSWALTDTARATLVIAGDTTIAESKQDCAAFHAIDIEKSLLFGQKFIGTRKGQPFRTMDGAINIISNPAYYPTNFPTPNVTTMGSTTNYTQLEAALDPCFNQATDPKVANERVLFVGGTARKALNNIGRLNGTYYMVDGQTNFGLQFQTFKISRGTFRMIEHPLFNTNPDWAKMAVAIDISTWALAYLGDRKTRFDPFGVGEGGDAGLDAQGGTLTTELTCTIKNPPANAVLFNLTAGAAG